MFTACFFVAAGRRFFYYFECSSAHNLGQVNFKTRTSEKEKKRFFFCLAVTQTRGVRNKSDITDQSSHVAKAIIAQINILNAVVMKLEGVIPGASNSSDKHQASSIF